MKKPKKLTQQQKVSQQRRNIRRAEHEHQRKLIRKLYHMAEQVNRGNYQGVKESPLWALNQHRAKRYLDKGFDPLTLVDLSMGL